MSTSLPIIPPRAPVPQRPKLSVNTSQPRSFGKGASLRLDTLSAVSPTRVNTFSNAYPALDRPVKPRLSIDSSLHHSTSAAATTPSSASTLSSAATSTSQDSANPACIPYKQPHNILSILANSPARHMLPRKMAPARPMFPAQKHVSFRSPLEEEITTVKYTLAHSDLESSISTLSSLASAASNDSDSDASAMHHSLSSGSPSKSHDLSPSTQAMSQPRDATASKSLHDCPSPRVGEKRDSSSSEDDSDSCPETPVAGRRKRTRHWRWTLGPLPGSTTATSPTASDSHVSEDSS